MWSSTCSMSSLFCQNKDPFSLSRLLAVVLSQFRLVAMLLLRYLNGFWLIIIVVIVQLAVHTHMDKVIRYGPVCVVKLWVCRVLIFEVLTVLCDRRLCDVLLFYPRVLLWIIAFPSHEEFLIVFCSSMIQYLLHFIIALLQSRTCVTVAFLFWCLAWCFAIRADATKVSESRWQYSKDSFVLVRSAVCTSEFGIPNFCHIGIMSTHTPSLSKIGV